MRRALAALCAALVCGSAPATAQDAGAIQITPILIQASPRTGLGSFRVHNGRNHETAFQLEAFAWSQDSNGESVLTPAPDMVLAPAIFLVPASGDQIVRFAVPHAALGGAVEQSYRILLRELPNGDAPAMGFRLVLEMSMPVFVTPAGARGELSVQHIRDADGAPALRLTNTGAARVQLSDTGDAIDLPRYLLAGQQITRPAPTQALQLITATIGDSAPRTLTIEPQDARVLADLH